MIDEKIQIIRGDEIDFRPLFQALWTNRKRIIKITAFVTFLGVIYALLATPLYESTITMYPSTQDRGGELNQLKGVASSFGIDVGGGSTNLNIPDILNSRRVKTDLIYYKWNSTEFNMPVDLIHYWEIDDSTGLNLNPITWIKSLFSNREAKNHMMEWQEIALEKINDHITIIEEKTGLIRIKILMEEPQLAADMVNHLYNIVVDFTGNVHNSQAKLNREFIENRQVEVKEKLTDLEEVLKIFRERNRSIMESPQLQLELGRLMREVEIKTQVYITLQKQYELARIDEVKETPSVIIIDKGVPAYQKDTPKRKLIVIVASILGLITGSLFSVFPLILKSLKIN